MKPAFRSAVFYGILRTDCRVSLIHLNGFMPHETGITPLQRCSRGGFVNEYGMWRSLVAHLTGGQGVAGSNPVIPTIFTRENGQSDDWPFVFLPFDSLSDSLRL